MTVHARLGTLNELLEMYRSAQQYCQPRAFVEDGLAALETELEAQELRKWSNDSKTLSG